MIKKTSSLYLHLLCILLPLAVSSCSGPGNDWPVPSQLIDKGESLKRVEDVPSDKISMAFMWSAHFQDVCSAFGMEHALTVAMMNPDMFKAVIDRITEFYLEAGEVSSRVEELIFLFPSGLVISPSHEAILPDIPPENVEAMFKPLIN